MRGGHPRHGGASTRSDTGTASNMEAATLNTNSAPDTESTLDSGEFWWFHSELPYGPELTDTPAQLTKNTVQWVPFESDDVAHLECAHRRYQSRQRERQDTLGDELTCPERFAAVKRNSRQYLKVDFERMRMMPIYWQSDEYYVRRCVERA